ncbi:MAG TPA: DNA-formamidopyrimidine glycosylase family protein, partial [Vicinamibacteria bacterium]|nr:DNA-formamidopyrimidine glycosylase family protein [Vicinamibacteria bacterium]
MPEGDTLWRVANRLSPVLSGRRVTGLRLITPALAAEARRHRVEGSTIRGVEARGKHLLVRFSTGVALHTHLGMTGSWHLYRAGSRWQQPAHLARVVLEADGVVAVCFVPRVVELVPEADEAAHPSLTALGPDVVSAEFDA